MTWVSDITASSPVLWARFQETSGTSAADAAGGSAGTYVGSPSLNQGSLLNAAAGDRGIALNGRDQYVTFPDDTRTDRGDVITIVALVIFTAFRDSAGNPAVIVDKGNGAYVLRQSNAMDGTLLFRRNGFADLCTSTTRLATNTLYLVVARKNGATSSLRVNKVDVTSARTNSTMANNSNVFSIGVADVTTGPANGFFPGRLDEIVIFSTSLSDATVDSFYDSAFNVTSTAAVSSGGATTATCTKASAVRASAVTGSGALTASGRKAASATGRATGGGTTSSSARKGIAAALSSTGGGTVASTGRKAVTRTIGLSAGGSCSATASKAVRVTARAVSGAGNVTGLGAKGGIASCNVTGGGLVVTTSFGTHVRQVDMPTFVRVERRETTIAPAIRTTTVHVEGRVTLVRHDKRETKVIVDG